MIHQIKGLYETNNFNEIMKILDNAEYLTEQESIYYPEMVPIRESNELGKYIIRLEDLVDYSLSNGISDGGYALSQICEASQVNQEDVVFSVNEVTILEDIDMEDTTRKLLETGMKVYAVPISDRDMAYIMTEAVVNALLETNGTQNEDYADQLFAAYVNDDFSYLNEKYIIENIQDSVNNIKSNVNDVAERVSNTVSQAADDSRKWTAKKISSLKKTKNKISNKIGNAGKQVINKIDDGIDHLKNKLK